MKPIHLLWLIMLAGCSRQDNDPKAESATLTSPGVTSPIYVGATQCEGCHREQYASWRGSHHDLAMQLVDDDTVLGNFDDAEFEYFGTVSRFFRKGEQFFVNTDGPDGTLTDYPITYVFGVYPLQQYLVRFPKGRFQVLNIAWDSRSKEQGGQRWFHLYPDEHIEHGDELHWTGVNHNWNYMCADCHSTHLQKNYALASHAYQTTWSEIDVGCEACHGPASRHVAWASADKPGGNSRGFSVAFSERQSVSWSIDPATGNAKRSSSKKTNVEIEACAQCHARRSTNYANAKPEDALLDNFQLSLLTEGLYHADGQIDGEVYVYGSFVQSKMYRAGVSCSDCHEPHSLQLRAEGNQLCTQCHLATKYDSTEHHFHASNSVGSQCVNCHMPAKTYMQVDARRDHSIRVPRPDLSATLDVPNACNHCHVDKDAAWAANSLKQQFGSPSRKHFAEAIHAGREGLRDAAPLLAALITDDKQPAIARATAVTLMPPYLSRETAPLLQMAANDEEPLLGLGLANALESIPVQQRLPFAYSLLFDDMRITRALAARSLVGTSLQSLPRKAIAKFNAALAEYKDGQSFSGDRPESLVNLANLYAQEGQVALAAQFYRDAISLAPFYAPAHVNFADFYRAQGDDIAGEAVLRKALPAVRDKAAIQHALGLLYVRQQNMAEALDFLRLAAESDSASARYNYVYAIALNSSGDATRAIEVLEQALQRYPRDTDVLAALVSISNELGDSDRVHYYEEKIVLLTR